MDAAVRLTNDISTLQAVDARSMLAHVQASMSALLAFEIQTISRDDRLLLHKELAKEVNRIEAFRTGLLKVIETEGDWRNKGSRTLQELERKVSGSSSAQSHKRVSRAKALNENLPSFKDALFESEITAEHVDIMRRYSNTPQLKSLLKDPTVGEKHLLEKAKSLDPDAFAKQGRQWSIQHGPVAAERMYAQQQREERLSLTEDGNGFALNGWLTQLNGTIVGTALTALMGVPTKEDPRGPIQRRAAALTSLCKYALDQGKADTNSRVRPHISVHVPFETILEAKRRADSRTLELLSSDDSLEATEGQWILETWYTQTYSRIDSDDAVSTDPDSIPRCPIHGHKGDCLREVAEIRERIGEVLAMIRSGIASGYFAGLTPASLDDGTALLPSQLQTLMCDSNFQRIIFDNQGEILDIGRANRFCTNKQARGVIARDRTCRYPGCSHTIEKSEIHHVEYWSNGGNTNIVNLVMLCWYHHQYIHQQNITITHHRGGWAFTTSQGRLIGMRMHENNKHARSGQGWSMPTSPEGHNSRGYESEGSNPQGYEPQVGNPGRDIVGSFDAGSGSPRKDSPDLFDEWQEFEGWSVPAFAKTSQETPADNRGRSLMEADPAAPAPAYGKHSGL